MNDQRKVIYEQRADIMDAESVSDVIDDMRAETATAIVAVSCPEGTYPEQWDIEGLKEGIDEVFGLQPPIDEWLEEEAVDPQMITERLQKLADETMAAKLERGRAGALDRRRKADPDPDARPSLEGASRDARCAAPGDPPAQLCAEEADRRI